MALGAVKSGFAKVAYASQSESPQTMGEDSCSNTFLNAEKVADSDGGETIGRVILAFGNNIRVQYAPESTEEDPIVQVTSDYGKEKVIYQLHINEINPRNASELEMFALLSYADARGISDGGTLGSYQRMHIYVENAQLNGCWEGNESYDDFAGNKYDWQKIVVDMLDDFSNEGMYNPMLNCISLNNIMEQFSIQFMDFENIELVETLPDSSLNDRESGMSTEITGAWHEAAEEAAVNDMGMGENGTLNQISQIDYLQFIREHIEELFVKIQNGDTEESFQIGASSFTIREWDKFLEKFDSVEDAIRELIEEEIEEREKEKQIESSIVDTAKKTEQISNVDMDMLLSDNLRTKLKS